MKKLFVLAATMVALAAATPAKAAILFDPTGGGCASTCYVIDLFDPTTGNSISIGLNGNTAPGTVGSLYFQANLGVASLGGVQQYANGGDGAFFTFAASFQEQITSNTTVGPFTTLTFGPTGGGTNGVFNMYLQSGEGSNLSGVCFVDDCGGTLVLSGTFVNDINFFGNFTANLVSGFQPLDQFGADNYFPQATVTGQGGFGAMIQITGLDPNYFPTLTIGSSFIFATTQQALPYRQADPSACFSNNAVTSCNQPGVASIGGINGLGVNTMLQTDASLSFIGGEIIPEPATLTLLGFGLLGSAAARRRMRRRQ